MQADRPQVNTSGERRLQDGTASKVRLIALGAVLALLSCASVAASLLVLHNQRTAKTDFVSLAVAQRLAATSPDQLYDVEVQLDLQRQLSGGPDDAARPFVNPPFVAQLAGLVAGQDLAEGYVRMALLNLAALAGTGWALCRAAPALGPLRRGLLILGMIGAFPVATAMAEGALSLIVGAGLALVLVGERERRDWWCAIGLALATIKPHLALVAMVVLICRGRWGAVSRFAVMGATMLLTSVATIGLQPWLDYPRAVLDMGGEAAPERVYSLRWVNLLTPPRVLFGPAIEPLTKGLSLVMLLAGLVVVGTLIRKRPTVPIGMGMVGITLCLPHVNAHDLAWLPVAFAMVWSADSWPHRSRGSRAVLLALAAAWAPLSWVLWPSGSSTVPVGILVVFLITTGLSHGGARRVVGLRTRSSEEVLAA